MANILVVEDDLDLNNAYTLILEHNHHDVEAAYNGQEALDKLKKFNADLIILDLLMPFKSGVEFLKEYNLADKPDSPRVVIFTNLENSPEINEALRLGAYKCIVKSWTAPQGLVKIVNDTLKSSNLEQPLRI